jgi:phage FluMu gp28-like protein
MNELADDDLLPTPDQAPPRSPVDDLIPGQLPPDDLRPAGGRHPHAAPEGLDRRPVRPEACREGSADRHHLRGGARHDADRAAAKSAGGDSTFYIGDTKEKGLAFVQVCAQFAKRSPKSCSRFHEFVFDDVQPDGSTKGIAAYRIRFASGHEIVGLSSNPANIRGLQGRVVIDEAAFHRNVAAVIDACNALLIWGGKIRIISTHNGVLNAFNELIKETRAGQFDYSIHTITFDDAVRNGLYERVCLMRKEKPTPEGKAEWYRKIRRSYGSRVEAMREELDAIPREGEGTLLTLAAIEACSTAEYRVCRWEPPAATFVSWPEHLRRAEMQEWLNRVVGPFSSPTARAATPGSSAATSPCGRIAAHIRSGSSISSCVVTFR